MLDEVTDKNIDEQGERMVPAFHKGALVYGEHLTRYESVVNLVKDKVVLDIASGSGYGSYLIGGYAKKVYGVDVAKEAVDYAKRNYSRSNMEYRLGSAEEIPLEDASVDVVVTFETIEHISDYKKFLKEIKRVLRPGGYALVSTPNDPEFPEGNHFHLHEFKQKELQSLLKKYFKHVDFTYQYTWLYTALMTDKEAGGDFYKPVDTYNYAPVDKSKALYFMTVCSDEELPASLTVKPVAAISEHYSARKEQEKEAEVERRIAELERIVAEYDRDRQHAYGELERVNEELQAVYNSKRWKAIERATKPLSVIHKKK